MDSGNKRQREDDGAEGLSTIDDSDAGESSSKRRKTSNQTNNGTDIPTTAANTGGNGSTSTPALKSSAGGDDDSSDEDLDTIRSPISPAIDFLDPSPSNVSKLDRISALARAKYPPTHVRNLMRYQLYSLDQQADGDVAVVESVTKAR